MTEKATKPVPKKGSPVTAKRIFMLFLLVLAIAVGVLVAKAYHALNSDIGVPATTGTSSGSGSEVEEWTLQHDNDHSPVFAVDGQGKAEKPTMTVEDLLADKPEDGKVTNTALTGVKKDAIVKEVVVAPINSKPKIKQESTVEVKRSSQPAPARDIDNLF